MKNLRQSAESLIKLYPHDIENDFIKEVIQFKSVICNFYYEKK